MLYSFNDVCRCAVRASDGVLGPVRDLEIDEETWRIERVGVRCDARPPDELLYLPAAALGDADWIQDEVRVPRSRAELAGERRETGCRPLGAQRAAASGLARAGGAVIAPPAQCVAARELVGLAFEASDGRLGRVLDVLFDSGCWAVRWLQVGPCPGIADNLLVPPFALEGLGRDASCVRATIGRRELAACKRLEVVDDVGSTRARVMAVRSAPSARRSAG